MTMFFSYISCVVKKKKFCFSPLKRFFAAPYHLFHMLSPFIEESVELTKSSIPALTSTYVHRWISTNHVLQSWPTCKRSTSQEIISKTWETLLTRAEHCIRNLCFMFVLFFLSFPFLCVNIFSHLVIFPFLFL